MVMALDRIRAVIKRRKYDAFLITQPENRRYVSGYAATDLSISESSGALLITAAGPAFLLTDFRYQQQAKTEAPHFEVVLYKHGLIRLLKQLLPRLAIRNLAFESHYMLHSTAGLLQKMMDEINLSLVAATGLVENLRLVKTAEELQKIEKSVLLNEAVFQEIYAGLRPGLTEREVALEIETVMRRKGADGKSFETIVAGGPNGALPHAVPTGRPLKIGEPIIIDMGLRLDGYCSDMTRTVVLGAPDPKTRKLFRLVRRAQVAAIQAIKAGVDGRDIDTIARRIIAQAGYGENFGHSLGHGVGLAVHEGPSLSNRYRKKLRAGMVVTVEPGIYLPGWGGIRLENMVVVTQKGCQVLNRDTTLLELGRAGT